MPRWIVWGLAFAFLVSCGPSERPKFNIKRPSDYEPIVPAESTASTGPAIASTEATATTGTEVTIVEVGAFRGSCDHTFSGINDQDLLAFANPSGLRSYRLAGIAIPPGIQAEAHAQLRSWLEDESIGLEAEAARPGAQESVYVYRCAAKAMINVDLVRSGLAVVSDSPSIHRDALNKASMEALSARRGVWGRKPAN